MRISRLQQVISLTLASTLVTSCGKKSDDKDDDDGAAVTPTSSGAGDTADTLTSADDLSDLSLSAAFAISLPKALEGDSEGSSLSLLAATKSQEACMLGQTVRDATDSLREVGNFFCHLEVEKDKIKFGAKYLINTNGVEFARIYVDDSKIADGKIQIGFCSRHGDEESNRQLITISGLSANGPKGTVLSSGQSVWEGQTQTWTSDSTFDMFTENLTSILAKQKHTSGDNAFVRQVELALKDTGVSVATIASKGSWGGSTFQERGTGKFDGSVGTAVLQAQGTHDSGTYSFARRAYFNSAGEVVTSADVNATVAVETSEVPDFLADGFAPTTADGWVGEGCPDYAETVDLNPDSAAHQACDGNREDHTDCWSQDKYESGKEAVTGLD